MKLNTTPWYKKPNLRRLYLTLVPAALGCEMTSGYDGSILNGLQAVSPWLTCQLPLPFNHGVILLADTDCDRLQQPQGCPSWCHQCRLQHRCRSLSANCALRQRQSRSKAQYHHRVHHPPYRCSAPDSCCQRRHVPHRSYLPRHGHPLLYLWCLAAYRGVGLPHRVCCTQRSVQRVLGKCYTLITGSLDL